MFLHMFDIYCFSAGSDTSESQFLNPYSGNNYVKVWYILKSERQQSKFVKVVIICGNITVISIPANFSKPTIHDITIFVTENFSSIYSSFGLICIYTLLNFVSSAALLLDSIVGRFN